jgi:hypothetical protein
MRRYCQPRFGGSWKRQADRVETFRLVRAHPTLTGPGFNDKTDASDLLPSRRWGASAAVRLREARLASQKRRIRFLPRFWLAAFAIR